MHTYRPQTKIGLLIFFVVMTQCSISCKKNEADMSPWYPSVNDNGEPILGVFESRIPCEDCERTKVALVIYKNIQTNLPGTYILGRVYVGKGNDRIENKGNVTITTGMASDPEATVYELDENVPEEFRLLWKINEDLLFILDADRKPKVGDAGHGYVLNRTN